MEPVYDLSVSGPELPEPLRPSVQECYETGLDVPPGEKVAMSVSATTDPVINVTLSGRMWIGIGDGFHLPPVTLAGPQPAPYLVEASGTLRGYYVRLSTVGPLALLGVDDYSLTPDGAPPLHEMVRPELAEATRRWERELLDAPGFEARVERTSRFLLAHMTEPDRRVRLLRSAVELIDEADGNVVVGDLARELGVGTSTLRRHFSVLGMSPKHFALVLRFRRVHAYLENTPDATWVEAVRRFGYSDQSHLVRHYRRFSSTPPTEFDTRLRDVDRRMGIEEPPVGH